MSATSETQKPTVSLKAGKRTVQSSFVEVIKKHPKNQRLLTAPSDMGTFSFGMPPKGEEEFSEEKAKKISPKKSQIYFYQRKGSSWLPFQNKVSPLMAAVRYENGVVVHINLKDENLNTPNTVEALPEKQFNTLISKILSDGCAASPEDYTFQQFGENLILAIPKKPNKHELLGSGGFGDVIKAYPVKNTGEIDTQHPVAVKIMKQEHKDTGNKLLWDVMASNKASYSSRVTKIGYQGKQRLASVMSELPQDLYTQHKMGMLEQSLDQQGRNRLAQQYVEAQHTLHENGIFQQDTKSKNVSVGFDKKKDGTYDTYVTFFDLDGISYTSLTIAPELAQVGRKRANAASDIYSATESLARIFGAKDPFSFKRGPNEEYIKALEFQKEEDSDIALVRALVEEPTETQREKWRKEDDSKFKQRKALNSGNLLEVANTRFNTLGIEQYYSGKAYTEIINLLSAMSNNDPDCRPDHKRIQLKLKKIENLLRKEEVDWADLESEPKDEADRKRKLSVLQERAEKREEAIKEALGINEPKEVKQKRIEGMRALHDKKCREEKRIQARLQNWNPKQQKTQKQEAQEQTIHLVEITDDESKPVADPSKAVANPGEEQKRRLDGILQSPEYNFNETSMIRQLWLDLTEMTNQFIETFDSPEKLSNDNEITLYNQAVTLRAYLDFKETVKLRKLPDCGADNGDSTPLFEEKALESHSRRQIITTLATTLDLNTKVVPKTEKQASLLGAIKNLVSRLISIFDAKPQVGISDKPESKSDSALANNIAGLFGSQKGTEYAKGLQARLENHLETTAALIPVTA